MRVGSLIRTISSLAAILFVSEAASACTICFGDPKSPLTHGALAGVLFLLAVVLFVLGSIAGMIYFWIRRARLLAVQAAIRGETPDIYL